MDGIFSNNIGCLTSRHNTETILNGPSYNIFNPVRDAI